MTILKDGTTPKELKEAEWRLSLKDMPTSALLEQAHSLSMEDAESDRRWDVVCELRSRGDTETFDAARNWCVGIEAVDRELAADLLGQLGRQRDADGKTSDPFSDRAMPLLEDLLDDLEARVVASAIYVLGHYEAPEPILARPFLPTHVSSDVRFAVACSLAGAESRAAIDTLIALSGDDDSDVRDWATFGLGTQCDLDTPEIRDAFMRRLDDEDIDTRCEAMVGLARRKDARVISHLKKSLRADWSNFMVIEAAGYMESPELAADLEECGDLWTGDDNKYLSSALRNCRGEADPEEDGQWSRDLAVTVPDWAASPTNG